MPEVLGQDLRLQFLIIADDELVTIFSPVDILWVFLRTMQSTYIMSSNLSMNSQFFYFCF